MKLSNKILIGFFGFILIYMTAAFTEIRLRGNLNRFIDSESISETKKIPPINHLILYDLQKQIKVIGSEHSQIEIKSLEGNMLQHLKYKITNDTLTLVQLDAADNTPINISIHVPKSTFNGLSIQGAGVTVESLDQKVLSVFQNDGWMRLEKSKIGKLNLTAHKSANFNISKTDLDSISALIDNSEVRIDASVRHAGVLMSNQSYLRLKNSDEIELKTDRESKLDLN